MDFINLDNATEDQFDDAQMDWFAEQLARDSRNSEIRSVVVGMDVDRNSLNWRRGRVSRAYLADRTSNGQVQVCKGDEKNK